MSYRSCTAPKEGLLFATHFSIREKGELHSGQEQDHTKDIYSVRGGELGSLLWTSGCCVFPSSLFLMGVLNCHLLVSILPLSVGCVCVCVKEADKTLVVSPQGAALRPQERSLLIGQSPNLKLETATRWDIRLTPSGVGRVCPMLFVG